MGCTHSTGVYFADDIVLEIGMELADHSARQTSGDGAMALSTTRDDAPDLWRPVAVASTGRQAIRALRQMRCRTPHVASKLASLIVSDPVRDSRPSSGR